MLPRRGNFRPLEVPQIKMFEATLQNHFWFVVEGERILCLFQKVSVSLLLFFFQQTKMALFLEAAMLLGDSQPKRSFWIKGTMTWWLEWAQSNSKSLRASSCFCPPQRTTKPLPTNNSNNQNSSWVLVVLHFSTCTKWQCWLRAFSTWASGCFPPGQHATHMSPLFRAVKVWTFSWL